jgi:PAS domain S-box-containing protein
MKTRARSSRKKRKIPAIQRQEKVQKNVKWQSSLSVPKRTGDLSVASKNVRRKEVKRVGAEETARPGEELFRVVADSLPELICYIDADGRYLFNNKAYEKRYDIPAQEFKGRSVREMMGEAGYAIVQPCIEKVLKGERWSCERYIPGSLTGQRYCHIDYVPDKDGGAQVRGAYVLIQDLTELKRAQETFQTVVETASDAMVVCEKGGKVILVNSQVEHLFGYARQELIGQPVEFLMPERFRQVHVEERTAYMKGPEARPMGTGLELYGRRKDGSEFPVEISLSPVETSDGVLVSCTLRDIAERKQLAEQIRWSAVLEERSRIARDIHDALAQGFTGVILNLEAVEEACANLPEEVKNRLVRAREVARSSLEEARRSILVLSTSPTVNGDLPTTIRALIDRYQSSTKTRLGLSIQGTAWHLGPAVEENLLRIVQQAMDNALQHARASAIDIMLVYGKKQMHAMVTDNGCGFEVKSNPGFGIVGMRERAKEIGGRFRLESQPGKGTRAEVQVPYPPLQAASQ